MIFGIAITILTIAAIGLAFLPALRSTMVSNHSGSRAEYEHDLAVYKDQLNELQAEIGRGAISSVDSEQARIEIARRLLAAETKITEFDEERRTAENQKFSGIIIAAIAIIFVPGIATLMYSTLGSPNLEAQPLEARILAAQNQQDATNNDGVQLRALVERAETHLQNNPDDGRGWDVLAPIYYRLGEGKKARDAYINAIEILGESASRLSGLGEVEVAISGGTVSAGAKSRFEAAALLDPNDGRSQFFLGLAEAQSGKVQPATKIWQDLAQNPNAKPEWRAVAVDQLTSLASSQNIDAASAPPIDQDIIDQMQNMSAEDRQTMIEGMVDQLDSRLTENGGSVEEWQRLIRARVVLNQEETAKLDLVRAVKAFANDEEKINSLRALAAELNLSEGTLETQ